MLVTQAQALVLFMAEFFFFTTVQNMKRKVQPFKKKDI